MPVSLLGVLSDPPPLLLRTLVREGLEQVIHCTAEAFQSLLANYVRLFTGLKHIFCMKGQNKLWLKNVLARRVQLRYLGRVIIRHCGEFMCFPDTNHSMPTPPVSMRAGDLTFQDNVLCHCISFHRQ